jgi:hypothetical protein
MSNALMQWAIPIEFVAIAIAFLLRNRLKPNWRIMLGAAFAIVGIGALLLTELVYSTGNTRALSTPLDLARQGRVLDTAFTTHLSGRFDLFLQTDHTPGIEKFGCLTGEPGFESLCPNGDPELDAVWTVSERGATVARGGSDLAGWHMRQAAVAPAEAARRRAAFHNDMAKIENPSDSTPLFHDLGGFVAQRGHTYALTLDLRQPAPALAAFHPRLEVGYSGVQTKGLGVLVVVFCLIGVIGGGGMILISRGA